MTFRDLLSASGMTVKQFAEYFDIPPRTVQNWSTTSTTEKRNCPSYLLKLMHFKLVHDAIIKQ